MHRNVRTEKNYKANHDFYLFREMLNKNYVEPYMDATDARVIECNVKYISYFSGIIEKFKTAKQVIEVAQATKAFLKKRKHFNELFGFLAHSNYDIGCVHPECLGRELPANLHAAENWNENIFFKWLKGKRKLELNEMRKSHFKSNCHLLSIGSPVSNYISRRAMGYSEKLTKLRKPRFPYEWILKIEKGRKTDFGRWTETIGRWKVIDRDNNEIYEPKEREDNSLLTDYLLVHVMPNTLDENAEKRGAKIYNFAGGHCGDMASHKAIWDNIEEIFTKVGYRPFAFQVLFEITDIPPVDPRRGAWVQPEKGNIKIIDIKSLKPPKKSGIFKTV